MTKEEIISQGWLEAYITGDLSDEELVQVEQHLADSEVQQEFERIQTKLEKVVAQAKINPNSSVKTKVISSLGSHKKSGMNYLMAASISIALLSSVAAFYFWQKYESVESQLASLQTQNNELEENIFQASSRINSMRQDLSVLINPAFTHVILKSTDQSLIHQAVIYFNLSEKQVYLNTSTLPELSEDQQYQLWALIDGQPYDAGVFDLQKDQFQLMNSFEQVDAFAITIEQKGGSTSPTLETMQVYGVVI